MILRMLFMFLVSTHTFAHNEVRVITIHNKTEERISIQATTAASDQYYEAMPLELEGTLRGPEIAINPQSTREFSIPSDTRSVIIRPPNMLDFITQSIPQSEHTHIDLDHDGFALLKSGR